MLLVLTGIFIISASLLDKNLSNPDFSFGKFSTSSIPKEKTLFSQTSIDLSYDARDRIGLSPPLWNGNFTGKSVTVAIVDTGIYANHSVFTDDQRLNWNERILAFYDGLIGGETGSPDDNQFHGTWVASILGGNSTIYRGVAPEVKFVILKVFYEVGGEITTNFTLLENAVDWIIANKGNYNIKITSMSFGIKPSQNNIDILNEMNRIIENLVLNGILVVAAAGNDGDDPENDGRGTINAPASGKSILAVGGVSDTGEMYVRSSKGPSHENIIKPDVCAPAISVYGAYPDDPPQDFVYASGTSGSTPFVSGLAALMLEKNENLSWKEIKSIISFSSYRTINPTVLKDNVQGWGIIQGYGAMEALENPLSITPDTEIVIALNSSKSVLCLPVRLDPGLMYFELSQLGSAQAEMYLFNSEPDDYGNPVLEVTSQNQFLIANIPKRMGIEVPSQHVYYLVVKLIHETDNPFYSGNFMITLVNEYRNYVFVGIFGISMVALIYIVIRLSKNRKEITVTAR